MTPPRHCEEQLRRSNPAFLREEKAGLLRGACHRARIRATRWLAMTSRYSFAFSRRLSPEVCYQISSPSNQRAQGKPGARCTRGLVCKIVQKTAHEHTGSAETLRPSLRNGFNGLYRALPGERLFATVALRVFSQDLTPAPRCQDHTILPSASSAFVKGAIRVHRSPPRVDDVCATPLFRVGMANHVA
jgi:hypothetical protein